MTDEQIIEHIEEQLADIGECSPEDTLLLCKPEGVSDRRFDRIAEEHFGLKRGKRG